MRSSQDRRLRLLPFALGGVVVVALIAVIVIVLAPGSSNNSASQQPSAPAGHLKGFPALKLPAPVQMFSSDSIWNTPVPTNAAVDSSSGQLIAALTAEAAAERRRGIGPWIATGKATTPIYKVPAKQPTVPVALDDPTASWRVGLQAAFQAVPIPTNAQPAAGNDGHMVVWQPSTNKMWEFFKMRRQGDGWHAAWGGAVQNVSENPGYYTSGAWPGASAAWGATATSLPVAAGVITPDELAAGRIDHALAIDLPEPRSGVWAWPAQRSDGIGGPNTIPEGARLRLNPSVNLNSLSLPPVTRILAQAAQRYGVIVRDQTRDGISFYAQSLAGTGQPNLYYERGGFFGGQSPIQLLANFPWSDLQVLKMHLCTQTPCEQ